MISLLGIIEIDFSVIPGQGVTIAIVGWLIVFAALVLLVIVFTQTPKIIYYKTRKKLREQSKQADIPDSELHLPGDTSAAIAMALYYYFSDLHDEESNVITIKRVRKMYSTWSSKIYGLRVWPRK
jgi:glutaconyl-CoA/methylmalonyl-CoA decarboxylase subunit delta